MKLSGFLNKPRWQSKDAALRRAGVAGDDDAELLATLATIARTDEDADVRIVAIKRLADAGLTQRLAHEDADPRVRAEARKLWFDLLAGTHPRSPTPIECVRLLRAQDDAALIEHVARTASDLGLRAAALARVTRVALLAERATTDPDAQLRVAALDRIDDTTLLDRLAERTRKTDKIISRRARERAEALRIAGGDPAVAESRARLLCEKIERLVREPNDGAQTEIQTQWSAVEAHASEALRVRYRAAQALLVAARERPSRAAVVSSDVVPAAPPAKADVDAATSSTPDDISLAIIDDPTNGIASAPGGADARADLDENHAGDASGETPAEPREIMSDPSTPRDDSSTPTVDPSDVAAHSAASTSVAGTNKQLEQEQRRAALQRMETAAGTFATAVAEGVLARAHAAHAELTTLRKTHRVALPRALQQSLDEAERGYAQLSQWQHWSDNQRRRQLCEAVEALAGSGLHPDAVATRVREAQAEWTRLDAAEGIAAGTAAQHGLARRFHAACRHALEPAKSYFKKRQELRKTHAEAISAALEQARAVPDDSSDFALIGTTRHAIVDALRTLDRIDPHDRKHFARDLKSALTRLDARLAAHQGEIERSKAALIAEAQALSAGESVRGAPAAARALQQRWQTIGNGRRDRDQAQWKAFRAALDAVFGKLDTERAERATRDAGSRTRAAEICAELEAFAADDTPPQRAAIARVESEWESLGVRDDALLRRFRAAQSALRDAGMHRERASRRGPYSAWLARYKICRGAERSNPDIDRLRAEWAAAPATDVAAAALDQRFASALNAQSHERDEDVAQTPADRNDADLRDVLIRLELFAGVESPGEDLDRRRALQIERLSARMRGSAATTPHQELVALLVRWTGLAPAPTAALDARLERDLVAALETLP